MCVCVWGEAARLRRVQLEFYFCEATVAPRWRLHLGMPWHVSFDCLFLWFSDEDSFQEAAFPLGRSALVRFRRRVVVVTFHREPRLKDAFPFHASTWFEYIWMETGHLGASVTRESTSPSPRDPFSNYLLPEMQNIKNSFLFIYQLDLLKWEIFSHWKKDFPDSSTSCCLHRCLIERCGGRVEMSNAWRAFTSTLNT